MKQPIAHSAVKVNTNKIEIYFINQLINYSVLFNVFKVHVAILVTVKQMPMKV